MAQPLTPNRRIIFDHTFDLCAEALGGHKIVDEALAPVIEALHRNPFAFKHIEIEWVSCRYAVTKPLDPLPALIVIFTIEENGDVVIKHAEAAERY
jgi:hypothetical protein